MARRSRTRHIRFKRYTALESEPIQKDASREGTADWLGTEHPYYDLADKLKEALMTRRPRWKRIRLLKDTRIQLPRFEHRVDSGTPNRLAGIRDAIDAALRALKKTVSTAIGEADAILEGAMETIAGLIVLESEYRTGHS